MKIAASIGIRLSALALLWTACMAQAQFSYTTTNGTVTITGYGGSDGSLVIPSQIDGLPVVSIADWAFSSCGFTNVMIPDSISSIGFGAYYYCASLVSVKIPDSLTNIADWTFCGCARLASVIIGRGVTSLGRCVFRDCSSLVALAIPSNVVSLSSETFAYCPSLAEITVEAQNPAYSSLGGALFNKNQSTLLRYPQARAGSYVIPSTVTNISGGQTTWFGGHNPGAFGQCAGLSSILMGSSVIEVGDSAFSGCSALTNLTLGSNLVRIGEDAFSGCAALAAITIPDSVRGIGNGAFSYCGALANIQIGNGVTNIGHWFSGCPKLKYFTIPEGVSSIGEYAFSGFEWTADQWSAFRLPSTLTSIGAGAFSDCTGLTRLAIPSGVQSIGNRAFYECVFLTNVVLPPALLSIGEEAFHYCTSISALTIPPGVTNIGSGAFSLCPGLKAVAVDPANAAFTTLQGVLLQNHPAEVLYCPISKTGTFAIPEGVVRIRGSAFYACSGLTGVTIPGSVTCIGDNAFLECSGLTSITVPSGVTNIGYGAFGACTSAGAITVDPLNAVYTSLNGVLFDKAMTVLLQCPAGKAGSFTIPDTVGTIGNEAFASCSALTSVTIGAGVTSIGDWGFTFSGLTHITIPDGVTTLGYGAFCGCYHLATLNLGRGINAIRGQTFQGCSGLTDLIIPDNIMSLSAYSFWYCANLASVKIGNGMEFVGDDAFQGCPRLAIVILGKGVRSFSWRAFDDCTALARVYFEGDAPHPYDYPCDSNATVYYLPGTTGWGTAFAGRPTAPWVLPRPLILSGSSSFGIPSNNFGFRISWATHPSVVVEASTTLLSPMWRPVSTNTLNGGWCDFRDQEWANYPARFYRLRSP